MSTITPETKAKALALIERINQSVAFVVDDSPVFKRWDTSVPAADVDFDDRQVVFAVSWLDDDAVCAIVLSTDGLISLVENNPTPNTNVYKFGPKGYESTLVLFPSSPHVDDDTQFKVLSLIRHINSADAFQIDDSPRMLDWEFALTAQAAQFHNLDWTTFEAVWSRKGVSYGMVVTMQNLIDIINCNPIPSITNEYKFMAGDAKVTLALFSLVPHEQFNPLR